MTSERIAAWSLLPAAGIFILALALAIGTLVYQEIRCGCSTYTVAGHAAVKTP